MYIIIIIIIIEAPHKNLDASLLRSLRLWRTCHLSMSAAAFRTCDLAVAQPAAIMRSTPFPTV